MKKTKTISKKYATQSNYFDVYKRDSKRLHGPRKVGTVQAAGFNEAKGKAMELYGINVIVLRQV